MAKTQSILKLVSPKPPENPLDALLGVIFGFEGSVEELRRRLNETLDRLAAGG